MYLFLGAYTGLSPSATVFTETLTVLGASESGSSLTTTSGQLVINGKAAGQAADVFDGDTVQLVLSSPSVYGTSNVIYLYQDNKRVGYAVVSTKAEEFVVYDTRYDNLLSYDSAIDWTITSKRTLHKLNLSGEETGLLDLNNAPVQGDNFYAIAVADYHRNEVMVIDTSAFAITKRMTDGQGPTDVVHYYDSTGIRTLTIVAYRLSNEIAVYNDEFNLLAKYNENNPTYLCIADSKLYVGHLGTSVVSVFTINANLTLTTAPAITFAATVTALFNHSNALYACAGTGVYDSTKQLKITLPLPARSVSVQKGSDNCYFTFGNSNKVFKADVLTGVGTSTTITGAIFLNTIEAKPDGTLFIFDTEGKKGYSGQLTNLSSIETDYAPYGVILSDALYLLDIYPTLPRKVTQDRLIYSLETSTYNNLEDIVPGNLLETGDIVVTTNRPINVQAVTSVGTNLLKNGVPQQTTFNAVTGDSLAMSLDVDFETPDPTVLGYLIGDTYTEIVASIKNVDLIPDNFYFLPKFNQPLSSVVLSDVLLIAGLDEPVEVTAECILIVNGTEVTQPVTLNNGDTLQLKSSTPEINSFTTSVKIFLGTIFSSVFSFITESLDEPAVPPVLEFGETFDLPLSLRAYSKTLDTTGEWDSTRIFIPEIYGASIIVNGVDVGRSTTIQPGDQVRLTLVTTYNKEAPHIIPVTMDFGTAYWIAWTAGDSMPKPFDFGSISGLSIKDYVQSDVVNPLGISNNVRVNIRVPYGTILEINNVAQAAPHPDYRGMPLRDYTVVANISPSTDLVLKGYGRPEHGTENKLPVYIGQRKGFWTLKTYDILSLEQTVRGDTLALASGNVVDTHTNEVYSFPAYTPVEFVPEQVIFSRPNLQFVTTSPTQAVVEQREFVATAPIKTFEHIVTWAITSATSLFAMPREAVVGKSSYHVTQPTDFGILYSNNPIEFTLERDWYSITNTQYRADFNREWTSVTTTPIKFETNDEYVVHSNNRLYFELSGDTIEATSYSHSRNEFVSRDFAVRTYNQWTTQILDLKDAIVFSDANQYKFKIPYTVRTEPQRPLFKVPYTTYGSPLHTFKPSYKPSLTNPTLKFDPQFDPRLNSNHYRFEPKFKPTTINAIYYFEPEWVPSAELGTILFDSLEVATISNNLVTAQKSTYRRNEETVNYFDPLAAKVVSKYDPIAFEAKLFEAFDSLEYLEIGTSSPVEFDIQYDRTPLPKVTHPGYFDSYNDAVSNAHLWGKVDGEYYVAQYPEKGFVWVVSMPCENLCDANQCPPHGYIHGG